jgi:hypothetical protein
MWSLLLLSVATGLVLGLNAYLTILLMRAQAQAAVPA